METRGTHILVEFWGCKTDLDDIDLVQDHMARAVFESGATLLHVFGQKFHPQGLTVFMAIAESHLSIHTWPEERYAALDIYTCGSKCMPYKALSHLRDALRPERVDFMHVRRGRRSGIGVTSFAKSGTCCKLGEQ